MGAEIRVRLSVEGDDMNLMAPRACAVGDFERQAASARKYADPSFLRLFACPGLMCLIACAHAALRYQGTLYPAGAGRGKPPRRKIAAGAYFSDGGQVCQSAFFWGSARPVIASDF